MVDMRVNRDNTVSILQSLDLCAKLFVLSEIETYRRSRKNCREEAIPNYQIFEDII